MIMTKPFKFNSKKSVTQRTHDLIIDALSAAHHTCLTDTPSCIIYTNGNSINCRNSHTCKQLTLTMTTTPFKRAMLDVRLNCTEFKLSRAKLSINEGNATTLNDFEAMCCSCEDGIFDCGCVDGNI